jgi:hypothetical protein
MTKGSVAHTLDPLVDDAAAVCCREETCDVSCKGGSVCTLALHFNSVSRLFFSVADFCASLYASCFAARDSF